MNRPQKTMAKKWRKERRKGDAVVSGSSSEGKTEFPAADVNREKDGSVTNGRWKEMEPIERLSKIWWK